MTEACAGGMLDFAVVSRDDPESLIKEDLLVEFLYSRRRLIHIGMQTLCTLKQTQEAEENRSETQKDKVEAVNLLFPWQDTFYVDRKGPLSVKEEERILAMLQKHSAMMKEQ